MGTSFGLRLRKFPTPKSSCDRLGDLSCWAATKKTRTSTRSELYHFHVATHYFTRAHTRARVRVEARMREMPCPSFSKVFVDLEESLGCAWATISLSWIEWHRAQCKSYLDMPAGYRVDAGRRRPSSRADITCLLRWWTRNSRFMWYVVEEQLNDNSCQRIYLVSHIILNEW